MDKLRDRLCPGEQKCRQLGNKVVAFSLIVLTALSSFAFYQWHDAQKNTLNVLAETSEAFLLSNRQLKATVTTSYLGGQIKSPIWEQDAAASQTGSQAIYTVQEHNLWEGHSRPVSSVVFSPDGKILASGSYDNSIKLWDIAKAQEITTLQGHSRPVSSVVFSPDGKTLASGSYDNSIKLWDIAKAQEITTLKGRSPVPSVASFSAPMARLWLLRRNV